jgi:hypothetical protein
LGYLPAQKAQHTIPQALKLIGLRRVMQTLTQGRMKRQTVNVDQQAIIGVGKVSSGEDSASSVMHDELLLGLR